MRHILNFREFKIFKFQNGLTHSTDVGPGAQARQEPSSVSRTLRGRWRRSSSTQRGMLRCLRRFSTSRRRFPPPWSADDPDPKLQPLFPGVPCGGSSSN